MECNKYKIRKKNKIIQGKNNMRKCSETKRNNTNTQMQYCFERMLNECKKNGYRPNKKSELGIEFDGHLRCLYIRKGKGVSTPKEILDLLREIMSYKTFFSEATRLKNIKLQKKEAEQKAAFAKKLNDKRIYLPKVDLIRQIYGDEMYRQFIDQDGNVWADKFLSKYLDDAIKRAIPQTRNPENQDKILKILDKHLGVAVSDNDLERINDFYEANPNILLAFHRSKDKYKPSKNWLHAQDVGILFNLTGTRIQQIIADTVSNLRANKELRKTIQYYIKGNLDKVFSQFPKDWLHDMNFQKKYNLSKIPYHDLEYTARWFYEKYKLYKQK